MNSHLHLAYGITERPAHVTEAQALLRTMELTRRHRPLWRRRG